MATKGFNPFLSEADYAAPAPSAELQSNPFLSDFGAPPPPTSLALDKGASNSSSSGGGNENPFFNPFGAPAPQQPAPAPAASSNAFMFSDAGPGGGGGGNPFAAFVDTTTTSSSNVASNGPFSNLDSSSTASSSNVGEATVPTNMWDNLVTNQPVTATAAALVPEPIFMMDTGPDENISFFDAGQNDVPPRPPPASVPSSTQELLNSVTGALEATSDSLMDRLRLAQPSPVNLAPSPSPSPRSPSPDLMGDDHPPPPPPPSANPLQPSPNQNILDLFDSPMQMSSGPKSTIDILGLYNNNISQPPPSSQPPPVSLVSCSTEEAATGNLVETTTTTNTTSTIPPPVPPPPADIQIQSALISNDISDLSPPPPAPTSAAAPPPFDPNQTIRSHTPSPMQSPIAESVPISRPEIPPLPLSSTHSEMTTDNFAQQQQSTFPSPPPPEEFHAQPAAVRAAPPPKPPAPIVRSPVHEAKPLPSRPPPPVPPQPRPSPQHQPHHPPPPAIPPQPHHPHAAPPVPPQPHHHPPPHPPPPVVPAMPQVIPPFPEPGTTTTTDYAHKQQQSPIVEKVVAPPPVPPPAHVGVASSSPFGDTTIDQQPKPSPFSAASSIFGTTDIVVSPPSAAASTFDNENKAKSSSSASAFDDFDAKFNSISAEEDQVVSKGVSSAFGDPFGGSGSTVATGDSAWGGGSSSGGGFGDESSMGFGSDGFDSFLQMTEPPPAPQSTPLKIKKEGEEDDEKEDQDLAIFIKPRTDNELSFGLAPALAPPPKSPAISTNSAYSEDSNNAFVPFLSSARDTTYEPAAAQTQLNRTDSQETPQTPLFEEDTSQPLEDFPRIKCEVDGWEMHMRHPNKKKITGQRFWKKVYVRIVVQNDIPIVHIFNQKGDKDPFQEIPLQPCYSVSEIGAQQFDQYGKIFTLKIQYVFYKERPGVRPGQISKAGRISDKLSQFAAFAIQGDYQGVKEFGSDLKKLGLPLEHAPQISQLVKLGTQTFEELKQFSAAVEEALFKLNVHRDRAIQYKTEEVQVTLVDEYYVEQDIYGVVTRQIARVRLFFLSFLSGMAEVEMGLNDLRRQGKEVVGRHDIIPIATEEWVWKKFDEKIRTEEIEFSNCVQLEEFEATKTIKFKPPDACYIELLRFRVRPPRHRELPLQVKTVFTTTGNRIEIRSDILVPGFTSRKLGQIPCEDVSIRFPIPESWIYMFRVEKHFRYGSVKSSHRRSGKVKGIERFLGAVEAVEQSLMEVTSGQAKYEHHFKSIVWRIARLPKEGQGAYTTHSFFCHVNLQPHETVPDNLAKHCYVEFTMPHTTISHTVCRSIAVPGAEEPPEKCVRYLSRHEYVVEIEHAQGFAPATYNLAATVTKEEKKEENTDRTADWFPTEKPKDADDSDFSD